jgi:hypothetical protein
MSAPRPTLTSYMGVYCTQNPCCTDSSQTPQPPHTTLSYCRTDTSQPPQSLHTTLRHRSEPWPQNPGSRPVRPSGAQNLHLIVRRETNHGFAFYFGQRKVLEVNTRRYSGSMFIYSIPPYKRWGSVAELTCHLQSSTPHGTKFSHKTYRPSPTKDVT